MKKFYKSLQRQDGFTLVELMVVVAIIGLLSAVAVPNFQKYQAKSKTSEAKLQLSAIYTAEAAFYSDYTIYHTCLNYMGFNPVQEAPSRYFTVGFNVIGEVEDTAYASAVNSGLSSAATGCPDALAAANGVTYFLAGKRVGSNLADQTHLTGTAFANQAGTGNMSYTAGAAGIVHKDFTTTAQSANFTINELKVFATVRNGY